MAPKAAQEQLSELQSVIKKFTMAKQEKKKEKEKKKISIQPPIIIITSILSLVINNQQCQMQHKEYNIELLWLYLKSCSTLYRFHLKARLNMPSNFCAGQGGFDYRD